MPYKTAFIVNPVGGNGYAARIWSKIEGFLADSGQEYNAYLTRSPGDGTRQAINAVKDGAELVVAVGGDGTLSEIINGINLDKNILGVIPAGTGNGFRRSCRIPGNWRKALLGLQVWSPRLIDLGEVNGKFFINVVGIGFDAAVEQVASGKYNNLKWYLPYLAAFLNELTSFRSFHSVLKCSGLVLEESDTFLVVAANGSFYGGNMCIAPQAELDDGSLNLLLIKKMNAAETTALAVQALLKKPLNHDSIIKDKIEQIVIDADQGIPVHIDGEVIGKLPVTIAIKPAALRILAPAG